MGALGLGLCHAAKQRQLCLTFGSSKHGNSIGLPHNSLAETTTNISKVALGDFGGPIVPIVKDVRRTSRYVGTVMESTGISLGEPNSNYDHACASITNANAAGLGVPAVSLQDIATVPKQKTSFHDQIADAKPSLIAALTFLAIANPPISTAKAILCLPTRAKERKIQQNEALIKHPTRKEMLP
ncbi:hypothetical protein ACH5RR_001277 [Cinchona calisaya]|uniref:Uncharacterized protein n=1 Tax=Cinchona calisaya TaxID=153742 RepID=A0ABD3B3D3_9GENT